MKFDSATGLYKGNGKFVRVELSGKNWNIYEIDPSKEKSWREWDLTIPIFSAPSSSCLNKDQAIVAWLKSKKGRV